jgi:hypothetical protein
MSNDRLTLEEFQSEVLSLLSRSTPFEDHDFDDEETPDSGVPTAVLMVIEWQGSDGNRWLSRLGMFGNGQRAPRWTIEMLAREAIHWEDTK